MNSNLTYPSFFTYKDLLLKKLYYSVVCSVLSQLVLLQVYVLVINLDIFDPFNSVVKSLGTLISVNTWLYVIPFLTIIFAQTIICAKDYVFKSSYCSTRFQNFLSLFSLHNLILLILNILVGSTLIWLFLSLDEGKYQNLTTICNGQSYCLNNGSFYLIVSGFWTGFYYFVKVYISEKHLSFPVIHQRKFLQLKAKLIPLFKESFSISVLPTIYFIILYYLLGSTLENNFRKIFGLLRDEGESGLEIYFYLWVFGSLYCFNMNLMKFFFNLFLTEPVEFPVLQANENCLTLQQSIMMSEYPIIQNLACLDLYNLAHWSKIRRQAFFTLSQPGGHPHNWNGTVSNILKLFTEYIDLLNKSTQTSKKEKPSNLPYVPNTYERTFQSPERFRNQRNMSLAYQPDLVDIVNVSHASPLASSQFLGTILEEVKRKSNNLIAFIKVVTGINFLFGELPQANIQKCLGNGHVIIWSTQGITELACASLTEDQYGIVQKDLPGIIFTLVQLKQSLDKLNKISALSRKIAGYDDFNFKMKSAVTMAVKRSLFNICRTFGKFLNDLPLNKEVVIYLQTINKS